MKLKILSIITILALIIVAFFIGIKYESNRNNKIINVKSLNDTGKSINALTVKAIHDGDTISYNYLKTEYMDFPPGDFLPIALEMANEHDYPRAYFDVYFTILNMKNLDESTNSLDEWKKLNPKMTRIALDYLLNAAELGDKQSIDIFKDYYLKNKKLNSILNNNCDLIVKYSKTLNKIK